jgi:hypothetical protein
MDQESDKISRLEDRIEQLEATTKKMMPTRRDALKFGGAAAIGAAAMSGTASAGSSQVGTIGDASNLVDVEAEDIDVSDTLTTQDIVVNGTATGPFGGGGIVLESGDSITVEAINQDTTDSSFVTLYNGSAKDVLGGIVAGGGTNDFLYTFSDSTTLHKNGSGTSYVSANFSGNKDRNDDLQEIAFLPPAKDVTKIEVGTVQLNSSALGAEVILKN